MKVRLPLIVQDPITTDGKIVEGIHVESERDHITGWGDGPTTSLVVVEDLDPATGKLLPGVKFEPPGPRRKMGRYVIPDDIYSREFISVSVLGAILKTMRLFADENALGRKIEWAFGAPQLRVLPRAGEGANAFYDRETGSLQFFYFPNPHNPNQTIYTSLSRDIVAHETAHALIDAIAPTLYDTLTPQALAVHEAIADLTALMTAFQSNTLRLRVLEKTRGSIRNPSAFSSFAPEFGQALDESGRANALRSLWNERTLDPTDRSLDEHGKPNLASPADPHSLSEVLSGALYRVMVQIHENIWAARYDGDFSSSGRALAEALGIFQRMVFRALDNLPPGEASFADYGRAISAETRDNYLAEELRRRRVIGDLGEVGYVERGELHGLRLASERFTYNDELVAKDNAEAHAFVDRHRSLFNIPARVPITVYPKLQLTQTSGWGAWSGRFAGIFVLLKVSWEKIEEDYFDRAFPKARSITCGTTITLNLDGRVLDAVSADVDAQRAERDRMVRSLLESGLLRRASESASDSGPLGSPIRVSVRKGVMKISGAGRLLHYPANRSAG